MGTGFGQDHAQQEAAILQIDVRRGDAYGHAKENGSGRKMHA